jgi:DNA-binding transcriptional MerR regulator
MAPGTPRDGGQDTGGELTVGELAAAAGMTVRNVRAYAARGLLPPPRLVGRTGMYGPHHVARLALVREMLQEGYTLAAIERSLEHAPASGGPTALALHRALMAPWRPEEPEEMDLATLGAKSGVPSDPADLGRLAALGVLEPAGPDRVRVLDPTLLAAGLQVVRLGVAPDALIDAQLRVAELVEEAARVYVEMFHSTVWKDFLDRGAPAADWPRLRAVVEQIQPVAAQALLASFRSAMATAVATELEEVVSLVAPDLDGGPAGGAPGEGR